MTGPEIMAAVGFIVMLLGAFGGLWWRFNDTIGKVRDGLADHKLKSAETFATKAGLTEALGRVHDALDRLADRIDALIASQSKLPTRRQ